MSMIEMDEPQPLAPRPKMPPEIASGIIKVMKQVRQLGYDDANKFQNYKYVSTDKFMDFMRPLLADADILIMLDEDRVEITRAVNPETNKETSWLRVKYEIMIFHATGAEYGPLHRQCIVPASGAQAFASAQSYLLKYFMRALFQIPTGDKDADDHKADELPQGTGKAPPPRQQGNGRAHVPPQNMQETGAEDLGRETEDAKRARIQAAYNAISKEIAECLDHADLDDIRVRNEAALEEIKAFSPTSYDKLKDRAAKRKQQITDGPGKADGEPKL